MGRESLRKITRERERERALEIEEKIGVKLLPEVI